jgi:GNAT superfamily N-acetyltransferase
MFRKVKPNTYNIQWVLSTLNPLDGIIGFNIFEYHANVKGDVEHIISSQFLFVDPKYRKKGIATTLLKLPDICDNPTYRVECKKTELRFFDKQGYKFKRLSENGQFLVLEK